MCVKSVCLRFTHTHTRTLEQQHTKLTANDLVKILVTSLVPIWHPINSLVFYSVHSITAKTNDKKTNGILKIVAKVVIPKESNTCLQEI